MPAVDKDTFLKDLTQHLFSNAGTLNLTTFAEDVLRVSWCVLCGAQRPMDLFDEDQKKMIFFAGKVCKDCCAKAPDKAKAHKDKVVDMRRYHVNVASYCLNRIRDLEWRLIDDVNFVMQHPSREIIPQTLPGSSSRFNCSISEPLPAKARYAAPLPKVVEWAQKARMLDYPTESRVYLWSTAHNLVFKPVPKKYLPHPIGVGFQSERELRRILMKVVAAGKNSLFRGCVVTCRTTGFMGPKSICVILLTDSTTTCQCPKKQYYNVSKAFWVWLGWHHRLDTGPQGVSGSCHLRAR